MYRIIVALSLICSFANCAVNNVTCPEEKDITPCVCYPHSAQIYCVGPNIDESHITKVGPKIKTENGLFHILLIRETKLKTIPKHAFSGAEFVKIYVENNHDLTHIDSEAFLKGNLSSLVVQNNPLLLSNDIFDLARNLTPSFSIEYNANYIKEIPANAFASDPNKSTISQIFLSNNSYNERIGQNAFIGNPHLTMLGLDNNNIHTIDDYGLNFTSAKTTGHQLTIYLQNNKLNSYSFNPNTIVIPRTIYATFHFENNAFNDLNEDVFRPLAATGNKFVFTGNKFYCDCRMRWVLGQPQSNNIHHIQCVNHNNTDVFSLKETDLQCY